MLAAVPLNPRALIAQVVPSTRATASPVARRSTSASVVAPERRIWSPRDDVDGGGRLGDRLAAARDRRDVHVHQVFEREPLERRGVLRRAAGAAQEHAPMSRAPSTDGEQAGRRRATRARAIRLRGHAVNDGRIRRALSCKGRAVSRAQRRVPVQQPLARRADGVSACDPSACMRTARSLGRTTAARG